MTSDRISDYPPVEGIEEPKLQGLTSTQAYLLGRLESLVARRQDYLNLPPEEQEPFESKLLARGVYASLMDCVQSGVGDQANAIIEAAPLQGK